MARRIGRPIPVCHPSLLRSQWALAPSAHITLCRLRVRLRIATRRSRRPTGRVPGRSQWPSRLGPRSPDRYDATRARGEVRLASIAGPRSWPAKILTSNHVGRNGPQTTLIVQILSQPHPSPGREAANGRPQNVTRGEEATSLRLRSLNRGRPDRFDERGSNRGANCRNPT